MQGNDINILVFWVCAAIGAVVYAAIIWSLVAYRKSKKQEMSFHKHTLTEIAWTVIPLLIIIGMTIPTAKLLTRLYSSEGSETIQGMTFQEHNQYTVKMPDLNIETNTISQTN